MQLDLEKAAYHEFNKKFKAGEFINKRFGQAFYDYFKLYRIKENKEVLKIYELNGDEAKAQIGICFRFV